MFETSTRFLFWVHPFPGRAVETSGAHAKWEEDIASYQVPIPGGPHIPFQGSYLKWKQAS